MLKVFIRTDADTRTLNSLKYMPVQYQENRDSANVVYPG